MPYITEDRREGLYDPEDVENPGELNYLITKICLEYIQGYGYSYQAMNDIIGALECAKLEMYRRRVAPYEDEKMKENGDVY